MKVDTKKVKEAGEKLYPDLASSYREAVEYVSSEDTGISIYLTEHPKLCKQLEKMNENLCEFLEKSADHLDRCGEVLVDVANDLDWTDEDNSHHIQDSSEGLDDKLE